MRSGIPDSDVFCNETEKLSGTHGIHVKSLFSLVYICSGAIWSNSLPYRSASWEEHLFSSKYYLHTGSFLQQTLKG